MDEQRHNQPGAPRGEPASQHPDAETLGAFLDGWLEPWEREAVASHVDGCADCRRELGEVGATVVLLRGLPQYEPRRSFQLSPRQVAGLSRAARPASDGGWLARLLPSLPALRAATVGVAMLLLAVTAVDLGTEPGDQEAADRQQAIESVGTNPPPPASLQRQADDQALEAPAVATLPAQTGPSEAEADESSVSMAQGAALEATGAAAPVEEPQVANAADQPAAAAAPASAGEGVAPTGAADSFAPPTAVATVAPSTATVAPTGQTATASSAVTDTQAAERDDDNVSRWRLAEVGLGFVLFWLVVTIAGLERLRRRR